jgi:hypothetical protein
MKSRTQTECGKAWGVKDGKLSDLQLPHSHEPILQIIRFYMQSVAQPHSQSWMAALTISDAAYDPIFGPQIAARALQTLQSVRLSRRSPFNFNAPACPSCSRMVTEHERRFMSALDSVRSGAIGQARAELMMLCEGNAIDLALEIMQNLNDVIATFIAQDVQSMHDD